MHRQTIFELLYDKKNLTVLLTVVHLMLVGSCFLIKMILLTKKINLLVYIYFLDLFSLENNGIYGKYF